MVDSSGFEALTLNSTVFKSTNLLMYTKYSTQSDETGIVYGTGSETCCCREACAKLYSLFDATNVYDTHENTRHGVLFVLSWNRR